MSVTKDSNWIVQCSEADIMALTARGDQQIAPSFDAQMQQLVRRKKQALLAEFASRIQSGRMQSSQPNEPEMQNLPLPRTAEGDLIRNAMYTNLKTDK